MSPHLIALLFLLAPPQNWTIDFNVTVDFSVTIAPPVGEPPTPAPAINDTPSCTDLMASYLAAAGLDATSDPWERTTEEELRGAMGTNHGCEVQMGVPLRQ